MHAVAAGDESIDSTRPDFKLWNSSHASQDGYIIGVVGSISSRAQRAPPFIANIWGLAIVSRTVGIPVLLLGGIR